MGTARTAIRLVLVLAAVLLLVTSIGCQTSPSTRVGTEPADSPAASPPAGEGSATACDDRVADFDRWFDGYCGLPHSGLAALDFQELELAVWRGDVEVAAAGGPRLYVTADGPMMRGFSSNVLMPFDAAQWPGPSLPSGPGLGASSGPPVLAIAVDAPMASVREAVGHLAAAGFDRALLPYRYDDSALRAGVVGYDPAPDDAAPTSTAPDALRARRRAAREAASGGCERLVSTLENDALCGAPTPLAEVVRACTCSVDLDALRGLLLSRIVEPQIGWVAIAIGGPGATPPTEGQWGEHAATHFESGTIATPARSKTLR